MIKEVIVQIKVEEYGPELYRINDTGSLVRKSLCTVISDDTEQDNEFVLPEKWCVSHCKESLAWIQKNSEIGGDFITVNRYYMFPNNKNMSNSSYAFPEGYTEITQDQFFAHVWEKEFKKEEPKKWNPQVGEWVLYIGESENLVKCRKVTAITEDNLHFEYIDGEVFDNDKMYYRKASPNEIPQPEPVLIAKAGEWVKITSFGRIKSGYKYIINKPYLLIEDLNKEHGFTAVDEELGVNGYYWRSIISQSIIFERCEAHEPVVQETTEDNYVPSVNEEHEEKLCNMEIAGSIAGFKFTRKDLDMIVSMYDLVVEYGGKLDLDTITETQFKVNSRHDSTV